MRRIKTQLNLNTALAVIALLIALGGTAYALEVNSVTSPTIKNGEVKRPDLALNGINSPRVANGTLTGGDVKNGSIGALDLSGPATAGARAYGRVAADATLSRSKNVTGVTNPQAGTYCISFAPTIDATTTVAAVGPDFGFDATSLAADAFAHVEWRSDTQECTAAQFEIRTFVYDGDDTDDNDGGGDLAGDNLTITNQPFVFVVP